MSPPVPLPEHLFNRTNWESRYGRCGTRRSSPGCPAAGRELRALRAAAPAAAGLRWAPLRAAGRPRPGRAGPSRHRRPLPSAGLAPEQRHGPASPRARPARPGAAPGAASGRRALEGDKAPCCRAPGRWASGALGGHGRQWLEAPGRPLGAAGAVRGPAPGPAPRRGCPGAPRAEGPGDEVSAWAVGGSPVQDVVPK